MRVLVSSLVERLRSSLFFVPMLGVLLAAIMGFGFLALDGHVDTTATDLPLGFSSTVESARTLLGVIAGATISFAGIAFSVALLIFQLTSSQYSPRVVHTLFRDPFNKRVMALVVGTFTYCLVVLRSVRSAVDPSGDPVIPNISVAVAVVLGIATILAVVAFINHSAHTMDVSEILERIRRETTDQIRREWSDADADGDAVTEIPQLSNTATTTIRSDRSGWVQQIDTDAILRDLPDGTTARVETYAGRYIIEHGELITLSPAVDADEVKEELRAAFAIGATRTTQQDVTYGLRQLVDVTVKALSPGINDPTTAQDAIFHTAAVLSELLRHDPPPAVTIEGTRRVVMAKQPSHRDLIRLAFDEPRRAAAPHPTVCRYLLAAIEAVIENVSAAGLANRTTELDRQARLIAKQFERSDALEEDIASVREAYAGMVDRHSRGLKTLARAGIDPTKVRERR